MARITHGLVAALAACLFGCDAPPETTAATTTSEAAPAATPTAAPKASAAAAPDLEKKPSYPCPDGTEGEGTLAKPCKASGNARIMDVTWTGKTDDQGPKFKVVSKAKHDILYGNMFVYFYDKAGKQLEAGAGEKKDKRIQCMGNIFAGAVKPGETVFVYLSCTKKDLVPEGTDAIEAEVRTAGFVAPDGKRSDTYWQNADLVPPERPKGGVK